ncbi:MAG: toxin-antitoxin system HicB family antitoxin [Deltaproteobacteria bacterium]|nr:toxin-antitoxin system HicB family antitoxin [Deltaproteobacteria bacterium]
MCDEEGIKSKKDYSGKFNVRVSPEQHARYFKYRNRRRQDFESMG